MRGRVLSVILVLVLCLSLVACSGGEKDNDISITIEDVTAAIQTVDPNFSFDDKPLFEMIGAKDGWMGYVNDTSVVKVYLFENESAYQKAVENFGDLLSEMPKLGNFVLECKNEDVQNAFKALENSSATPSIGSQSSASVENGPAEIVTKQVYAIDGFCEFTIQSISFSYDVLPDAQDSFYTHYQAEDDKIYLDIDIDVKNLQKEPLMCDNIATFTLDYNDGYTYTAFAVVEDSTTGFTYANITAIDPLETKAMRYLVDCPIEVYTSDHPLFLTMQAGNKTFHILLRDASGATDNLSPNEAKFTDAQRKEVENALAAAGIEATFIENAPPASVEDEGDEKSDIMLANCSLYYIHAADRELYMLFFDTKYDKAIAIGDNPGTESGKIIWENLNEWMNLYSPPETTTEPQYTAPQKPPAYFEEDIISCIDVSEGKTVPEDILKADTEVIY